VILAFRVFYQELQKKPQISLTVQLSTVFLVATESKDTPPRLQPPQPRPQIVTGTHLSDRLIICRNYEEVNFLFISEL
jgi:hypothetical protein